MSVYRRRAPITVLREIISPVIKSYVSRPYTLARARGRLGCETRKLYRRRRGSWLVFTTGIRSAKPSPSDEPLFLHLANSPFLNAAVKRKLYILTLQLCSIHWTGRKARKLHLVRAIEESRGSRSFVQRDFCALLLLMIARNIVNSRREKLRETIE